MSSSRTIAEGRSFERPYVELDEALIRRLSRHCLQFRDPDDRAAWFQFTTTFALFILTVGAMLYGAVTGLYVLLLLFVPAGGLLVRLFGFQHDCGHYSFFTSKAANRALGRFLSVFTLTPFGYWKEAHAVHHRTSGDLGRRGIGDIDTLTVDEYRALSPSAQRRYRLYRHPIVIHLIGPPVHFIFLQRSPFFQVLPFKDAWKSIMGLNLAMLAFYGGLAFVFGPVAVSLVVLPTAMVACWIGGWLFYVQHQFEETHWDESDDWKMQSAALNGSSYYVMPKVLQWFTGNIGLHQIHHLNSRIPNYRLQACLDQEPILGKISRLSIRESLQCVGLALWDPTERRLVGFR